MGPSNISKSRRARKLKLKTSLDIVKYSPPVQHFTLGRTGGTGRPSVNFGPPKISESTRARMLKMKSQLNIVKYSVWVQKFLRWGASRGVGPPSVNLGFPNYSIAW